MAISLLLTLLHGYYDGPFVLAWSFDPLVTTGIIAAAAVYIWAWRRVQAQGDRVPPSWYAWSYAAGLVTLAFSLLGPLETYNEQLFTLHMTQHLVIMQVTVPLILLGRPVQLILRALPRHYTKRSVGLLFGKGSMRYLVLGITAPLTGFLLFNGNMGFWHLPEFYDASVRYEWVHQVQHLMFAGFSGLYWWTIIEPVPRHHRLPEAWAIGSIFLSMMVGSVIGAVLTLSSSVLYPFYTEVQNPWGWSPLLDQQVGGLIMWVGSFLLYFGVLITLAVHLLQRDEADTDRAVQSTGQEQAAPSS